MSSRASFPEDQRKTDRATVRLPKEQMRRLKSAAKKLDMPLSEFIAWKCLSPEGAVRLPYA